MMAANPSTRQVQGEPYDWTGVSNACNPKLQEVLRERDVARAAAREIRHQARSQFGMTTDKLDALHPWLKALEAE